MLTEEKALSLVVDYVDGTLVPERATEMQRFLAAAPEFLPSYLKTVSLCRLVMQQSVSAERLGHVLEAVLVAVEGADAHD